MASSEVEPVPTAAERRVLEARAKGRHVPRPKRWGKNDAGVNERLSHTLVWALMHELPTKKLPCEIAGEYFPVSYLLYFLNARLGSRGPEWSNDELVQTLKESRNKTCLLYTSPSPRD